MMLPSVLEDADAMPSPIGSGAATGSGAAGGSGAEKLYDVQAWIFKELEMLAASQNRIETVLDDVSKAQESTATTMADVTKDLGTIVGALAPRRRSSSARADAVVAMRGNSGLSGGSGQSGSGHGKDSKEAFRNSKNRRSPSARNDKVAGRPSETQVFQFNQSSDFGAPQEAAAPPSGNILLTLPSEWPSSVALRQTFDVFDDQPSLFCNQRALHSGFQSKRGRRTLVSAEDADPGDQRRSRFRLAVTGMINPNSSLYRAFSFCGIVILLYDLFVVPFLLAWELPFDGTPNLVSAAAVCFWTLDVLLNFIIGFHRGGILVKDPLLIARHYVKTWFFPDMLVLLCDWLNILVLVFANPEHGPRGEHRMSKFDRIGRLLKISGMLRLVKFVLIVEEHAEKRLSETYRLLFRCVTMFCGTFWLNHILACVFFALGRAAPSNTGAHWIDSIFDVGEKNIVFMEEDVVYQYVTSFHWAVSQITLVGIESIDVCNTTERLFNILLVLLGLIFGCTAISSLSATMVEFQMLTKDKKEKIRTLRTYLRENNVEREMAFLVQQQAAERLAKKAHLTEKDVHALSLISASLRNELKFDICHRHIIRHPLWRLYVNMDASMAQNFCSQCVKFIFPMPHDDIFVPGTMTDCCYFVIRGKLMYTQEAGSSMVVGMKKTPVGEGQWLSEAAMWSHWTHVGTLEAETECQLTVVQANKLDQVLQRNRLLREITFEYCKQFHTRITSAKPPNAPWPNDLDVPFTEYGHIVVSMDQGMQLSIGLDAIDNAGASWNWHRGRKEMGLEKLKKELEAGKSTVTVNGNGDVERIVLVVAIRLEREDGYIFTQLAKKEDSEIVANCQFPGGKQEYGELTGDAVQRILWRLGLTESDITIKDMHRTSEWKDSAEYGVRTKYLRTLCHAELLTDIGASKMTRCRTTSSQTRNSLRSSAASKAPNFRLANRELYLLCEKKKTLMYAWLTLAEFDLLKTAGGETMLLEWLADSSMSAFSVSDDGPGDGILLQPTQDLTWPACRFAGSCQSI